MRHTPSGMNIHALRKALSECTRFEIAARLALNVLEKQLEDSSYSKPSVTAGCRRASMDLTRALAVLRRRES